MFAAWWNVLSRFICWGKRGVSQYVYQSHNNLLAFVVFFSKAPFLLLLSALRQRWYNLYFYAVMSYMHVSMSMWTLQHRKHPPDIQTSIESRAFDIETWYWCPNSWFYNVAYKSNGNYPPTSWTAGGTSPANLWMSGSRWRTFFPREGWSIPSASGSHLSFLTGMLCREGGGPEGDRLIWNP